MVVEINFFEHHTPVTFPPRSAWEIPDDVVSVDDIEEKSSSGFKRAADSRGHTQIGFLVEIPEGRQYAIGSVELAVIGHLPHVGMDEVDRKSASLSVVRGADEHGQGEIETGHSKSLLGQLQGMSAIAAANIENLATRRRRQGFANEPDLSFGLRGGHEGQGAKEVFVEYFLVPWLCPLLERSAGQCLGNRISTLHGCLVLVEQSGCNRGRPGRWDGR